MVFLKYNYGGSWVAQSVKHLTSPQVMISHNMGWSPTSGSVLTALSLEPALESVSPSPSPSAPPLLTLNLSLFSKKEKKRNIKTKFLKINFFGGAWVAQLVERLTSAQVMILQLLSLSPVSSSVLTALSLEPASDSVSPFPSPTHTLSLCLCFSLSQK